MVFFPGAVSWLLVNDSEFCSEQCFFPPGYLLSWEAQGQKESRVERTMSNSTLEYKVTGLTSLTTYTLEVAAINGAGTGMLSSSTISSGVPPGEMLSTVKPPTAPLFQL